MFKSLIVALAVLPGLAGAAAATDFLPTHKPSPALPVAPPPFTWTGFYVGLNAGGALSADGAAKTTGTPGFRALGPAALGVDAAGFIGGAQIGYNEQVGTLVLGVEADIDGADLGRSSRFTRASSLLGATLVTTASQRLADLGTLRARLGYTPADRWMIYATGGLAYGEAKLGGSVTADGAPALSWSGATTRMQLGLAVGAGAEYALTDHVSVKAEYLYYDLGRIANATTPAAAVLATPALAGVSYAARSGIAGSLLRAGVDYRF